jgi:hypothetical protein
MTTAPRRPILAILARATAHKSFGPLKWKGKKGK